MHRFVFAVEGSTGNRYDVAFSVSKEEATASCTCRAGLNGIWCKHRTALLDGDISALRSANPDDVLRLADAFKRHKHKAFQLAARSRSRGASRRDINIAASLRGGDRVRALADVAGTGIKAGMLGTIRLVQHGGRRIGLSTDLAATAYLVRFGGGAERWMKSEEVAWAPRTRGVIPRARFSGGLAEGWAFAVPEGFKRALDIKPAPRILSEKSELVEELQEIGIEVPPAAMHGDAHALALLATALRQAEVTLIDIEFDHTAKGQQQVILHLVTEGRPPAYSFAEGDMLHEPPAAHGLSWSDALKRLSRSVQVDHAVPGRAPDGADPLGDPGRVVATLRRYEAGEVVSARQFACSQAEFVTLLRTGVEPGA